MNFLFSGSWDKQVRAIDLKLKEVDRAFVASRECINVVHLFDKWLFVAGMDPLIRQFDLTSGEAKEFQGHESWVLCMTHHTTMNSEGEPRFTRLFSGSDDQTIRVWDIKNGICLNVLYGHKCAVLSLGFIDGRLYSGSQYHRVIVWSLADVEQQGFERQTMAAEDLRSKKFEAFEAYMESKGKRKKAPAKKKKK
jgi:WD40 repeat protein